MNILDLIITHDGSIEVGSVLLGEREVSLKTGIGRTRLRAAYNELFIKCIISQEHGKPRRIIKDIYTGEEET